MSQDTIALQSLQSRNFKKRTNQSNLFHYILQEMLENGGIGTRILKGHKYETGNNENLRGWIFNIYVAIKNFCFSQASVSKCLTYTTFISLVLRSVILSHLWNFYFNPKTKYNQPRSENRSQMFEFPLLLSYYKFHKYIK